TGSITVTAPTGSGLTYSIDGTNYQASTSFTGLASGTYSVTVKNSDGCISSGTSITINPQPATPVAPTLGTVVQPTSCNPTGSFVITNYNAAYNYTVSPSAGVTTSGNTVTAPVGTYMVTATLGGYISSASASITFIRPATLTAVISASNNVDCFGASSGSATVSVTGGTGPYTYSWNSSPVQTLATASNLPGGTYTVTVTDGSSCTTTQNVTITQPSAGINITGTVINSTCGATNNGSVDISLSGGTTPYTYLWNTGETTQDISNKAAGTYTVTVTDAKNCSTSSSFTITASDCQPIAVADFGSTTPGVAITGNVSTNDTPSGDGGNTWSLIGTNGGAALGTVSMNPDGSFTYTPNPNTSGTDTFSYQVCDVDGDCSTAIVTITIDASTLSITVSSTNVQCFGNNDGTATVTANGGTGPYTYSWNTTPVQTSSTANNLSAGSYTVTVTDNVGTIRTEVVTITQPTSALVANIDIPPVEVKCFGANTGSATASATGGTGSYNYLWSNGATTATASNLAAGNYTVTVTDANGCTNSKTVTIAQPSAALSISISAQTNVNCFGSGTGSATALASGGTSPYNYSWNTSPVQASATANNLSAGSYTVTVTDANGCTATQNITITQPTGPVAAPTASAIQPTCSAATGTIEVTAQSGTGITYSIDGTNYQASTSFTAVASGTYSVTVRNGDGCTSSGTSIVINAQPATPAAPTASAIQPTCSTATGTIEVTAQSGTGITYSIDGTNYQASTSFTAVASGTYSVTVRNGDGCTSSGTSIVINTASCPSIVITKDGTFSDINNNGIANVGDVITYSFKVTNSGNVPLTNVTVTDNNAVVIGGPIANLGVGVSDASSFSATHTLTQADIDKGTVYNLATATGTPPTGSSVTGTSTDTTPCTTCTTDPACPSCTITPLSQTPSLRLTKTGVFADANGDGKAQLGEKINYSFKVENTGNVTLTNLKITDPKVTVTGVAITLAPGAIDATTFTAVYTITQSDLDAGRVDNLATATGTDPKGKPISDDSENGNPADPGNPVNPACPSCTITPLSQTPSLRLTKTGVFADANGDGKAQLGEKITYSFKVENTGNVTLTNLKITDPKVTVTGVAITLTPGEIDATTFTAVYTITQSDLDAGRVDNLATATGTDPKGKPISDDSENGNPADPGNPVNPACPSCTITPLSQTGNITLVKQVSNTGTGVNGAFVAGNIIEYSFTLINTGSVTLNNIVLNDPIITTTAINIPGALAPGAAVTVKRSYPITLADINRGQVTNTATVTAQDALGKTVKDISGSAANNDNPTVTPLASPPVATNDNTNTKQGQSVNIPILANDIPGSSLLNPVSVEIVTQPAHGTLTINPDGTVTYKPDPNYNGTDSFIYTVKGRDGLISNPATVNILVTPSIPVAVDDATKTGFNTPVQLDIIGNDRADGSSLDKGSLEILTQPAHGTLRINADGTVVYTPNPGFTGIDTFTYRIKDASDTWTNIATGTITIEGFFIPNVFTPNGDGKNDAFFIVGLESFDSVDIEIYNRWGNQVYRMKGYKNDWTGYGLNEGTYFYKITLKKGAVTQAVAGPVLLKR
ncbi:DUF7507 domain-containing protein, partial [Pedobacter mendelii]